ncbi:MAG: M23 family metallopeptidase [Clostridia bacterium]|nr:M23 family metallopeptidase [Clostridia bacterium]
MNSSFFKTSSYSLKFTLFLIVIVCIFMIPIYYTYPQAFSSYNDKLILDDDSLYVWPIPEYTKITSPFGKRVSPTAGASSFHKGIDVGAPEDTKLYAICDGKITYVGFLGGGGYTITLTADNMKITYCHVSPKFIVDVGDEVKKGEWIANVGPKNVYGIPRKYLQR